MRSRGRARHPKYGDREGFIVSKGSPSSWRVKFDERKSIQSIHRDYLEKVDSADHSWQADCGLEISIKRDRNRTERPVDLYSAPRASEVCSVCPLVGFSDRMYSLPRTPYTEVDATTSQVLNLADVRRYADEPAASFIDNTSQPYLRGPLTYLELSGGGADGAYGAGVLNGWTASGTRPTFLIVSGVSAGALIAPFAFLGPQYDETLRDIYTSGVAASLIDTPNVLNALFGGGLSGNSRLRELVA